MLKISKNLNVSDTTIKKWCIFYEINIPPKGYWTRRKFGYSHEEALNPSPKRKCLPAKRFTKEQVLEIRKLINENNLSLRKIGKLFNVCHGVICKIRDGKTYKMAEAERI